MDKTEIVEFLAWLQDNYMEESDDCMVRVSDNMYRSRSQIADEYLATK